MNDNLTKLLEQLAAKLNTTAEHLWEVLVYQAYVNGIIKIIVGVIALVLCIILFKLYFKLNRNKDYDDNFEPFNKKTFSAIGVGVLLIVSVACLVGSITPLVNPEYWALDSILSKLRSK